MTPERRTLIVVGLGLALLSLPALIDPGAVGRGAALLDAAASPHPWFVPAHLGLLYVWLPVVVVSSLVLVLAPGLVITLAAGAASSAAQWLLLGLATSIVLLTAVVQATEAVWGAPLRGGTFAALALATTIVACIASLVRPRLRWKPDWRGVDAHPLIAAAGGAFVVLVLLEPKFLWETFNGDGAHAFEAARLVLHQAAPFWGPEGGALSSYPGPTDFLATYPTSWFVRLFGEVEASARVPYLLFLSAGLYPALLALIETGRADRRADPRPRWLLWAGLIVFSVVMGFSATYNPYHADIGMPAAFDALLMALCLGFCWAFVSGRSGWTAAFAILSYTSSPNGLLVMGMWLVAATLVLRPVPVRQLVIAAGAIVLCMVAARFAPLAMTALGQPVPGGEQQVGRLSERLLHLQWRDWHRFIYVIVPAGILPAFAVFLFPWQDRVSRAIALTAALQFAFFFVQARVSLHYFVPAMILPLVIFWRTVPERWPGRGLTPALVAAALVALIASWPAEAGPHLAARAVGAGLEDRLPGYDETRAAAFRRSELLKQLIPTDSWYRVPEYSFGGSPLSWFYYAHRATPVRPSHYVLQSDSAPAPAGGRLAAREAGAALYVMDEAALARDLGRRPPISIARIYYIEKSTLFFRPPRPR